MDGKGRSTEVHVPPGLPHLWASLCAPPPQTEMVYTVSIPSWFSLVTAQMLS